MDEMQFRYTKAKQANHLSFRYNLRLRLAVIERLRNMYIYYDYAHHKAEAVAELRRELFGEEVEIVTDGMLDSEMEDWTENLKNGSFQSHTYFSKRSYKAEKQTINFLPTIRLPCILIWNKLMRIQNFLCSKFRVISRFHVLFTIIDKISDNSFEGASTLVVTPDPSPNQVPCKITNCTDRHRTNIFYLTILSYFRVTPLFRYSVSNIPNEWGWIDGKSTENDQSLHRQQFRHNTLHLTYDCPGSSICVGRIKGRNSKIHKWASDFQRLWYHNSEHRNPLGTATYEYSSMHVDTHWN